MFRPLILCLALIAAPLAAAELRVLSGPGALQRAIAGAEPGDVLRLDPGLHPGPVVLDRPLTLTSTDAVIDGQGQGTVITITADNVSVIGLTITGSGMDSQALDAGVKIVKGADRALVEANRILGNLHGVDVHGGRDTIVRNNTIEGTRQFRVNDRGNGIYVWNAPGAVVEGNTVRWGRDGIFPTPRATASTATTCSATCALPSITCTPTTPRFRAKSAPAPGLAMPSCFPTGP
nr:nitrous oxide reductase maturation protein [uncultured bacterium]